MFNSQDHGYLVKPLFAYNGIFINLPKFGKYLNPIEEIYVGDAVFATNFEEAKFVDMLFNGGKSVCRTRFARCYVQYKNANNGDPLIGKLILGEREFDMKLEFIGNDLCILCPVGFSVKKAENKIRKLIKIPN